MTTQAATTAPRDVLVGIALSKTRLDVALRPGEEHGDSAHEATGGAALVARRPGRAGGGGPRLVGLEATGGRAAGGGRQPAPGAGLRQSDRAPGQDRGAGRGSAGALRPGAPSPAAPAA